LPRLPVLRLLAGLGIPALRALLCLATIRILGGGTSSRILACREVQALGARQVAAVPLTALARVSLGVLAVRALRDLPLPGRAVWLATIAVGPGPALLRRLLQCGLLLRCACDFAATPGILPRLLWARTFLARLGLLALGTAGLPAFVDFFLRGFLAVLGIARIFTRAGLRGEADAQQGDKRKRPQGPMDSGDVHASGFLLTARDRAVATRTFSR